MEEAVAQVVAAEPEVQVVLVAMLRVRLRSHQVRHLRSTLVVEVVVVTSTPQGSVEVVVAIARWRSGSAPGRGHDRDST